MPARSRFAGVLRGRLVSAIKHFCFRAHLNVLSLCPKITFPRKQETGSTEMGLFPSKIRRKGSATRQAALLAVEWSAIIFSGMLAVLFLSWALQLRLPQINISNATESAP